MRRHGHCHNLFAFPGQPRAGQNGLGQANADAVHVLDEAVHAKAVEVAVAVDVDLHKSSAVVVERAAHDHREKKGVRAVAEAEAIGAQRRALPALPALRAIRARTLHG